jgi:hypothetical protein
MVTGNKQLLHIPWGVKTLPKIWSISKVVLIVGDDYISHHYITYDLTS